MILKFSIKSFKSARRYYTQNTLNKLPLNVQRYVKEKIELTQPSYIHICDGSERENEFLIKSMINDGVLKPLKGKHCYLALTDPRDVARVELRTVISTKSQLQTIPKPKNGFKQSCQEMCIKNLKSSQLGNWISRDDLDFELLKRLPGCMRGRTMYVIPFSMGPLSSSFSKLGVELTDSPYVVCSMRIMTRVSEKVLEKLSDTNSEFVKCLHSVGVPLPTERKLVNNWPCNPENTLISHIPDEHEIISYGSGYGGNSLLGKKCFALRIGSIMAKNEGWLAEHMLILGLTNPQGIKKYIVAAFPSACGKTNLAMLTSTLPGWKVECVGDDIAWMHFDREGILRAINPENGFFGVAPGTSYKTNPNAMATIKENTIFTNVAMTSDGYVFWEGIDKVNDKQIISWKGKKWSSQSSELAAHPNSRFCAPARQCPIIDPRWEDPQGVPIDAIVFGGRRAEGIPLVYETFNWTHGVLVGASLRSESTAAAEHAQQRLMHDPFAMRPFFGYNFGHYLAHWLSMNKPGRRLPKIFHVNWFRQQNGQYLWPGYGDNIRVLEWIFNRSNTSDSNLTIKTPIGYVPNENAINFSHLNLNSNTREELFKVDKNFWIKELTEIRDYFDEHVNDSMPKEIYEELDELKRRIL